MKDWKTSLGGFLAAVGLALLADFDGRPEWFNLAAPILGAAGVFFAGLQAKDKTKGDK